MTQKVEAGRVPVFREADDNLTVLQANAKDPESGPSSVLYIPKHETFLGPLISYVYGLVQLPENCRMRALEHPKMLVNGEIVACAAHMFNYRASFEEATDAGHDEDAVILLIANTIADELNKTLNEIFDKDGPFDFLPFWLVKPMGIICDTETMEPVMPFMSRYAILPHVTKGATA